MLAQTKEVFVAEHMEDTCSLYKVWNTCDKHITEVNLDSNTEPLEYSGTHAIMYGPALDMWEANIHLCGAKTHGCPAAKHNDTRP